VVWAAVIHEYDLIVIVYERGQYGEKLTIDIRNVLLFTIRWDDDGDEFFWHIIDDGYEIRENTS
jgi:hypothetical protein